jgi:hypothetical protein
MNRRTGKLKRPDFKENDRKDLLKIENELRKHAKNSGSAMTLGAIAEVARKARERHYMGGCSK